MTKFLRRGEVHWVNLDPTVGTEINKRRPCLIISNDAMNEASRRVIVAPITSSVKHVYPFEVQVEVQGRSGKALLDQVRAIDKLRLSGRISLLNQQTMELVDKALKISFGLT